jgi:RNA ligase (TIGR02306 family)
MSDLNQVIVVPVSLEKHPDADTLSIVRIEGYNVVVRTEDWINEDRGAYIPPDNVVDVTRPEFKFLDEGIVGRTTARIKAKRLRGVMSQGLLIPVPKKVIYEGRYSDAIEEGTAIWGYEFNIGDDVTEYFGVTRYVSPVDLQLEGNAGEAISKHEGPSNPGIKYDIDSWFKYRRLLPEGTEVVLTEKIHGTNARYTYQDGKMWCGSRSFYRRQSAGSVYWRALEENPWIEEFCRSYPDVVLYGEIFGWVQTLRYGSKPGQLFFRAFDVFDSLSNNTQFWGWDKFYNSMSLKKSEFDVDGGIYISKDIDSTQRIVPFIYRGFISDELIEKHMDGPSVFFPGHIREGIVIKPVDEMYDLRLGRVILKAVSPVYLSKQK